MNEISIRKFEVGRSYHTPKSEQLLFHLENREGNELTFKVIHRDDLITIASGTVETIQDSHEIVRVSGPDGTFRLDATVVVPVGRRLSELSPERQTIILTAIKEDVERRKNKAK